MNNYDYVLTLSQPDIAGFLTACGYALRESITLVAALEELGFSGIDIDRIQDVTDDYNLQLLASFCLIQLQIKNHD